MNRFDRILGILLFLRSGKSVSTVDLAKRFDVSRRTIYRDMETLSALGVPVYAERGREGGFHLLQGYFLPPLMFSTREAVSLLLGLTFLHSLPAKPFRAELETAEEKLLAAVPDNLRPILTAAQKIIGCENQSADIFHPEPSFPPSLQGSLSEDTKKVTESNIVSCFLQAILDQKTIVLHYHSPYRSSAETFTAEPYGLFWDRNHWYLVGKRMGTDASMRLWRADRVLDITLHTLTRLSSSEFDVRALLGRRWLQSAMEQWRREAPVQIRLSPQQAQRLQQDWYYRHAHFEQVAESHVVMTFGEDNCAVVLELLRWLGPGAELIAPKAWRSLLKAELHQMFASYTADDLGSGE